MDFQNLYSKKWEGKCASCLPSSAATEEQIFRRFAYLWKKLEMNCLRLNYPYINLSAGFIGKAKFDHTLSLRHFVTLLRGNGDEIFGDELLQNHYMLWFY